MKPLTFVFLKKIMWINTCIIIVVSQDNILKTQLAKTVRMTTATFVYIMESQIPVQNAGIPITTANRNKNVPNVEVIVRNVPPPQCVRNARSTTCFTRAHHLTEYQ